MYCGALALCCGGGAGGARSSAVVHARAREHAIHACACQRGVAPVNLTSATSPRISTTRRGNAHYGCLDMSLSTHACAHARARACSTCTCVHDVVFRWAARAHARVCVHSSVRIGVCYMTVLCVRAGCVHARVCTSLYMHMHVSARSYDAYARMCVRALAVLSRHRLFPPRAPR